MKMLSKLILSTVLIFTMSSCALGDLTEGVNQKFGDQHFKTVIALIELHRVRHGEYPQSLKKLEFTGDWDAIMISSVEYTKVKEGYNLDLINGWIGKPEELIYPDGFWTGLGLKKSNLKN